VTSFINVKKFLYAVAQMGLPGFSVKDLEEVRLLPCLDMHVRMTTFYFVDSCIVRLLKAFI
jgi:hypothetical protein